MDDVNIGHFTTEYAYDALGRRIEKRHADGTATRYVYDGSRVAEEWAVSSSGGASLSASYVYGNYIDEVLTMRRGTSDYYYHGDDQHNVVKLTDNTGTIVESYDYGDYGQPEFYSPPANPGQATGALLDVSESPFGNPYLFTGRRWDEELGYYYFRNRYMDPALGRFVSRDPIGLWGDAANLGNGYTYAASNPWSMVDPFGLKAYGNQESFVGTFTSGIFDWQTYRDYGPYAFGQFALGLADWGTETIATVQHVQRMQTDPFYLAATLKNQLIGVYEIATNPVDSLRSGGESLVDYIANFDVRDAGKLFPDLAGGVAGGVKSGAARGVRGSVGKGVGSVSRSARGLFDDIRSFFRKEDPKCFVAGTLVLTSEGRVPIEDIAVGDQVYSRDDETGEESYQPVLQTFVTPDMTVLDVEFSTDNGATETITATFGHPFWVVGDGWTDTEDLKPGMKVCTANEGTATVERLTLVDAGQTVYNFEVDNTHTYFVGDADVWVHNTCPGVGGNGAAS